MKAAATLFAILGFSANAFAASCPIIQISNQGSFITFGHFKGHLISDSAPGNSTAWEGPLMITNPAGKTCEADLSIISPPFFFAGTHYLYVTTYSGSENIQYLVDANNCQAVWTSPPFTGDPSLTQNNTFVYLDAKPVRIQNNCEPVKT